MQVTISTGDAVRIVTLAAADREREVCGLLLGERGRVDAIVEANNVADNPKWHFEVDPQVVFAAIRSARGGGPGVIGSYHSHPTGHAEPSATDAGMIGRIGEVWLIVAGGELSAWIATTPNAFERVTLATYDPVGQSGR